MPRSIDRSKISPKSKKNLDFDVETVTDDRDAVPFQHSVASEDANNDEIIEVSGSSSRSGKKRAGEPEQTSVKKRHRTGTVTSSTHDAFASPVKREFASSAAAPVAVTPDEAEQKALAKYVPTYIHKNLDYRREGESIDPPLSKITLAVYRLIRDNYEIPPDFEQRRAFGPLSGVSFEERVIQEYSLGRLAAKDEELDICTCCATVGHKRFECDKLV